MGGLFYGGSLSQTLERRHVQFSVLYLRLVRHSGICLFLFFLSPHDSEIRRQIESKFKLNGSEMNAQVISLQLGASLAVAPVAGWQAGSYLSRKSSSLIRSSLPHHLGIYLRVASWWSVARCAVDIYCT